MKLLPRDEKFYSYFQRQTDILCEAAQILFDGVTAGNAGMDQAARTIEELENKADRIIHETMLRLNSSFITPIDPEDIHTLASHLDDVIDGIEETSYRIAAYRVEPIPADVVELCSVLVSCGKTLHSAVDALAKGTPFMDQCIEVNRLESKADMIGRRALADLFRHETDAIQLIKLKEVYEILEKTTDYCENVANVLQEVMVKNG